MATVHRRTDLDLCPIDRSTSRLVAIFGKELVA